MSRPLRIEYEGALYHIISRGNAKQDIFLDKRDRDRFLNILSDAHKRYDFIFYSYCLMKSHYHLLVETPEGNISRGMRYINGVYTQYFNKKNGRVGHLFQGRYKSIVVDKESYLLELIRYIVLNPLRAKIVKDPEKYEWSSYQSIVGLSKRPEYLYTDFVLSQFSKEKKKAIEFFKRFVADGVGGEDPEKLLVGELILGNRKFINNLKNILKSKRDQKEIPRTQRYADKKSLDEIFKMEVKEKIQRDKLIYKSYIEYGYTMKEVSEYLGVHYSTVSKAIKRVEKS